MKKVIIALLVLCFTAGAYADLLAIYGVDGGMETSYDDLYGSFVPTGCLLWTGDQNWASIDHEAELTSVTGIAAHGGDGYWMLTGGGSDPIVGMAPVPGVSGNEYTFGCWIKVDATVTPSSIDIGFDLASSTGAWLGNDVTTITLPAPDVWAYYEYTTTLTNASLATIKPKVAVFGNGGSQDGIAYTDDWTLTCTQFEGKAIIPDPEDGGVAGLDLVELTWANPDPNSPGDIVECDVFFGSDANTPGNMTEVASDVTDETADISGITLVDGQTYFWYVVSTSVPSGDPTSSDLWSFMIADVAAAADAGADQYLWLDGGSKTFTVSTSYTDDAKSPITLAEIVEGTHDTGGATVTMGTQTWTPGTGTHSSGTVSVDVTVDGDGWFEFIIEVTDSAGTATDSMHTGVYPTCLDAAYADPDDDIAGRYPDGHGDVDGDCDTDLADLAMMAGSWLDCMTDKATPTCTPQMKILIIN